MAFKRNADKIKQAMAESAESVVEQSTPVETAEKTATESKKPVPRRHRSIGDLAACQHSHQRGGENRGLAHVLSPFF